MLCSVDWWIVTGVSGQLIGPFSKGQEVEEDLACLTFEDGTDCQC